MVVIKSNLNRVLISCGVYVLGVIFILFVNNFVLAKNPKKFEMPPAMVEAQKIAYTTLRAQVSAIGSLVAIPGIVVRPEMSGRVTKIYFKSGETVKQGDLLIEINPDIIISQLTQYKASLNLSKLAFDRAVKLYSTRTISKADFDQAQADLASAQARVDGANAQLRQARITAPFSGRLGLSLVNIGDFVSAGQNIVNLESLDPINVDFSIPETYMGRVAVGQDIEIRSGAFANQVFAGKVDAIESQINPNNRSLTLRASLSNKDHKLLPGGFVDVKLFTSDASQKVISIPQVSVMYAPDGNFVYRIVDNKAIKTLVTLGNAEAQNVIIEDGLKPGDVVVTAGQQKVQDGSPVIVIPAKQA